MFQCGVAPLIKLGETRSLRAILVFTCALVMLSGCSTPERKELGVTTRIYARGLGRRVQVQDVRTAVDGGSLRVQVTLQNKGRLPRDFKYLFEWFDSQGIQQYAPANSWMRRTIQGGQVMMITGTAANSKVADWRLIIQPWKK